MQYKLHNIDHIHIAIYKSQEFIYLMGLQYLIIENQSTQAN